MVNVFQSDVGWNFTMKAVLLIVVVVSLSVFIPPVEAKRLKITGEPVSSGEFYDLVVHNYTVVYPRINQVLQETHDVEKRWAAFSIARPQWRLKDEDGKIWDYTSRVTHSKERLAESFARGNTWEQSVKIKKVTMTDATHGAVLWISINDWERDDGALTRSGRNSRRILSHWERIDGQWLVVFTELGKRY